MLETKLTVCAIKDDSVVFALEKTKEGMEFPHPHLGGIPAEVDPLVVFDAVNAHLERDGYVVLTAEQWQPVLDAHASLVA